MVSGTIQLVKNGGNLKQPTCVKLLPKKGVYCGVDFSNTEWYDLELCSLNFWLNFVKYYESEFWHCYDIHHHKYQ